MARVTVAESQRIARTSRGIRMFRFEMGKLYHILFLGEQHEGSKEPIMYMNPTHNVRKDGSGFEVRCANQENNISDVVLLDEEGQLMLDPRTQKPLNDGTCPYCEVRQLFNEYAYAERDKWIKENPTASKDEIKEFTRKLFTKSVVGNLNQARVMLVAVFELDQNGKPLTDGEGNKIYTIQAMKFSEHRFNTKFLDQVKIKKMGLEDENDGGIAWHEYYFNFPNADNKMTSGKDMSISIVPTPILSSDEGLKEELKNELSKLDLDELEEQMFVFKLKSLDEMEKDVAPQRSRIQAIMSEEDIDEALEELGEDVVLDEEDIESVMGTANVGKEESEPKDTEKETKSAVGSESFEPDVTEEDIDKLL